MSIKVLIADDHKIVREGLCAMIESQSDMQIIGNAENGMQALTMTKKYLPDIVVMDINMPVLNGIDATSQIMEAVPNTKIIALSMYENTRFIQNMFRAGAAGYLLKDCAFDELVVALKAVNNRKKYVSPSLANKLLMNYMGYAPKATDISSPLLTNREREVLQLIAEGTSTRDISHQLFLSIKTIEAYRRKIMRKLGVNTVAGLTRYAVSEGLTLL